MFQFLKFVLMLAIMWLKTWVPKLEPEMEEKMANKPVVAPPWWNNLENHMARVIKIEDDARQKILNFIALAIIVGIVAILTVIAIIVIAIAWTANWLAGIVFAVGIIVAAIAAIIRSPRGVAGGGIIILIGIVTLAIQFVFFSAPATTFKSCKAVEYGYGTRDGKSTCRQATIVGGKVVETQKGKVLDMGPTLKKGEGGVSYSFVILPTDKWVLAPPAK